MQVKLTALQTLRLYAYANKQKLKKKRMEKAIGRTGQRLGEDANRGFQPVTFGLDPSSMADEEREPFLLYTE